MLQESLTVLGIGFGVVFVGLICLIGMIYLMSFLVRLARHEERPHRRHEQLVEPEHTAFIPAAQNIAAPRLSGRNRRETVAAVSAAIAEYMGTDVSGIRIHSIKPVGGQELTLEQRRELIAVISAAVATQMGADVSAIRIHSIKKAA